MLSLLFQELGQGLAGLHQLALSPFENLLYQFPRPISQRACVTGNDIHQLGLIPQRIAPSDHFIGHLVQTAVLVFCTHGMISLIFAPRFVPLTRLRQLIYPVQCGVEAGYVRLQGIYLALYVVALVDVYLFAVLVLAYPLS
jgi:hypothetical protein